MQSLNLDFESLYEAFNSNKTMIKQNKNTKKKANYGAVSSGGVMDFVE